MVVKRVWIGARKGVMDLVILGGSGARSWGVLIWKMNQRPSELCRTWKNVRTVAVRRFYRGMSVHPALSVIPVDRWFCSHLLAQRRDIP